MEQVFVTLAKKAIFIGSACTSLAVLAASANASQQTTGITAESIKIGVTAPVSGPDPALGEAVRNGILFAFEEANKNGGIHGRQINAIFEDDGCSGGTAVAALKKLTSRDEVFALVSGTCAAAAVASAPVAKDSGTPMLGPYAMPGAIIEPVSPYTFLMNVSLADMGHADVDFAAKEFQPKRIAIIYQSDAYGRGALAGSVESAKKHGIEIVAQESVERGAPDLTPQVLRLRDLKPDVTIMHLYALQSAFVIRKAHELGIDTKFVIDVASADPRVLLEQAGKEAVANRVGVLSIVRDPAASETNTHEFMERYRKALPGYASRPGIPGINDYVGHSAAEVVIEALRRAGPELDRTKYIEALESISNFETVGISPVTFGPNDHRGLTEIRFFTFDEEGEINLSEGTYEVGNAGS